MARVDLLRRPQAAATRHLDVEQRDVGLMLGGERDRLVGVRGLRDQFDPRTPRHHRAEQHPHDGIVVRDQQA